MLSDAVIKAQGSDVVDSGAPSIVASHDRSLNALGIGNNRGGW